MQCKTYFIWTVPWKTRMYVITPFALWALILLQIFCIFKWLFTKLWSLWQQICLKKSISASCERKCIAFIVVAMNKITILLLKHCSPSCRSVYAHSHFSIKLRLLADIEPGLSDHTSYTCQLPHRLFWSSSCGRGCVSAPLYFSYTLSIYSSVHTGLCLSPPSSSTHTFPISNIIIGEWKRVYKLKCTSNQL